MSELIAELRENCQKLQTELLDSRNNLKTNIEQQSTKNKPRDTSSVGVQVTISTGRYNFVYLYAIMWSGNKNFLNNYSYFSSFRIE